MPITVIGTDLASWLTGDDVGATDCVLIERLRCCCRGSPLHRGEQGLEGVRGHAGKHVESGGWCNRSFVGHGNGFPPGYRGSGSPGHLVFICGMKERMTD